MGNDDKLFTVEDPLGYEVTCTQKTYDEHISEHTAMQGKETEIELSIKEPNAIYKSMMPKKNVYFWRDRKSRLYPLYVKSVVRINSEEEKKAEVVTSFPVKHIRGNIQEEEGPLHVKI